MVKHARHVATFMDLTDVVHPVITADKLTVVVSLYTVITNQITIFDAK